MPYRAGHREKPRLSPLPSYSNALQEKYYLTSRPSTWTTTFTLPIPFRRNSRLTLILPIPSRMWQFTSSKMGRRRGCGAIFLGFMMFSYILFALTKRFVARDKAWPQPFGKPPTLVFRREDLQRIWEWEIASGHYASARPSEFYLFCAAPFLRTWLQGKAN